MGFNRRFIDIDTINRYLEGKEKLDVLFSADAFIFMDDTASKVYGWYVKKLTDEEIKLKINELYESWYEYVDKLEQANKIVSREIYDFRYKIEELRVSLFAQELKTQYPVSLKRLWRELESI